MKIENFLIKFYKKILFPFKLFLDFTYKYKVTFISLSYIFLIYILFTNYSPFALFSLCYISGLLLFSLIVGGISNDK